jgi:hypothetical protein
MRRLGITIRVLVTPEVYELIDRAAVHESTTKSAIVRRAILADLRKLGLAPVQAPVKARRSRQTMMEIRGAGPP